MKKLVVSICILFLLILLGTTSNAASDFTLKEINFNATLNADGSMNVTETWDITVHSLTNTLFKTFDLEYAKYSGISDVKVSEIDSNGKEIAFNNKNQEVFHVDKNCYYGLVNSNGDYEIAWGINEKSGNKTYKISYKVKDCIKKYNDISELYWQFIGKDFSINVDKITGTINIPNKVEDKNSIKAWAHGPLNGNINIDSSKKVSFELEYFDSGNLVEVRLAMPNEIFTGITYSLKTDRLDTILQEEQNLADQANKAREEMLAQKEKQEKFAQSLAKVMQTLGIALSVIFVMKINKYESELTKKTELKPEMPSKYYRDIPRDNATPGEAAFLYYLKKGSVKKNIPQVLSATMLSLAYKNYIRFEMEEGNDNKEQIKVVVLRKDASYLKTDEREIYELLKRIQDENSGFSMKELEIYAKDHYSVFLGKLDKLQEIVEEQMKKEGMYNKIEKENSVLWWAKVALYIVCMLIAIIIMGVIKNVPVGLIFLVASGACAMYASSIAGRKTGLNQNSINEKEAWEGLKRYMEDYSMIEDREVPELIIWEKYLIYATVFGIADKVLEQLKVQYPELADGTYTAGAYMGIMYQNGINNAIINSINKSTKVAYNTGVSQRAEYDYSNSSSGDGFGGGFSGGGFGGGTRWRSAVVVVSVKKREKWSKKE